MVALEKVGKSCVVCNILGKLAKGGGEFLERFSLSPSCPKVITIGTDQPLSDWREVVVPNGLMVRKDLTMNVWKRRCHPVNVC